MPKYEVLLNGRNFLCAIDGADSNKFGFFVTRYVESENPEEAELKAVESVCGIERLQSIVCNLAEDPPRLFLDAIRELDSFDEIECLEPGIAFYSEDD